MNQMTDGAPTNIWAPNLSLAWALAYRAVSAAPAKEIVPLIVSFGGVDGAGTAGAAGPIEPEEVPTIRQALDVCLASSRMQEVHTVANTIFPQSLWTRAGGDRGLLFSNYVARLPDFVSMAPAKNARGLYFARLVAFDTDPKTGKRMAAGTGVPHDGNQLEFIIRHLAPRKRRSYLQASIFDPARDHSESAQLGFPCLQHVTFVPRFATGHLQLNAFYATQYVFEKAYGNFLGLARLGMFVAGEAGLRLGRVTCYVGVEQIGDRPARGPALEALHKAIVPHVCHGDASPTPPDGGTGADG